MRSYEEFVAGLLRLTGKAIHQDNELHGAPVVALPKVASIRMDDFFRYNDVAVTGDWQEQTDGGTAPIVIDAADGVVQMVNDVNDNDETYVGSIYQSWKFDTDKHLWFNIRLKLTEANTDDANIIAGLSDTFGADLLQDNGAGPAASFDGAVFYKLDGGSVWRFLTSNAASQNDASNVGSFSDGNFQSLAFHYDPNDGVTAKVTPYVDGVAKPPLNLTISGLEEMNIVFGVKNGGANAETLQVDYVSVTQEREEQLPLPE
jgi:hypothetical protein